MLKHNQALGSRGTPKGLRGTGVHQHDRRTHVRQTALLRVAVLHAAGTRDLCVVKNISPDGLSARAYRTLAVGDHVQVEFKSGELLGGSVVWGRECDIGIVFPEPIDVEAVLAGTWVTEPKSRRNLPRIAIDCGGRLKTHLGTFDVTLQDISQSGARVEAEAPGIDRGEVLLNLPGLPPIAGVIRWLRGTQVGISFNECIAFERLARWIEARRVRSFA
jgi:hypothetical protein